MVSDGANGLEVKKKKAHVLFVSIAFPGHFGPFVQLMYHLEGKYPGLTVTVMGNKDRIADLVNLQNKGELQGLDLHLEEVFGPIPVYRPDPKFPVRGELTSETNYAECEPMRKKLVAQKDIPGGPTAIIADFFQYWSKDLADELGIPWYTYFSVSPLYTLTTVEVPKLLEAGVRPGHPGPHLSDVLTTVPGLTHVPGRSFVRVGDLPGEMGEGFGKFYAKVADRTTRATAVLLNYSEEMDSQVGVLAGLKALTHSARVLPIGPSLQHAGFGFIYAPNHSKNCLRWLDSHPAKSVLYIAFGTLGSVSEENIKEIAAGVEASGVPFLWVLRLGSKTLSEVLPPGFLNRTKERGLIETEWAPQSRILFHPSTGGFLSHCGWNSTMEGICAGVPFVAWPLSADQLMNARYIADIGKVGFAVCYMKKKNRDSFENITRLEVKKAIRLLMLSEEGVAVRKNVTEMQRSLEAAVKEGGSSHQNLHTLLEELVNT